MTTMDVLEVMTPDPECCSPDSSLREVAEMMVEFDCGEIPVCDDKGVPLGVVTDRDIVCRVVATGLNPNELAASDCMSSPVVTTTPDTSVDDCARIMETHQLRRIPVVDEDGVCCGIVAQADLATKAREAVTDVVEKVSQPSR